MAFALWVDRECVWAEGTHEYRPMGVAVIAATGVFRAGDFARNRRPPPREATEFKGLFASLEAVNRHLRKRQSQGIQETYRQHLSRIIPTL